MHTTIEELLEPVSSTDPSSTERRVGFEVEGEQSKTEIDINQRG
jgi:hypothetical protein